MRAFAATRRGRPRSRAADCDRGTPELQAVRQKLAAGADPALTENPLGILLARGLINAEQHAAGCRYERLYRLAVAHREISFGPIYRRLGEATGRNTAADHCDGEDEKASEARRDYLAAKASLLQAGMSAVRAVEALAVFGEWPDVLLRTPASTLSANDNLSRGTIRKVMQVRAGLDALIGPAKKREDIRNLT